MEVFGKKGFPGNSAIKNPHAMQEMGQESQVQVLDQEDLLEKGNLLQYFCLENSMDRGAWCATVHGVPKEQQFRKHIA